MEENGKEKRKSTSAVGGLIFVGCMFIGGGIGMIFNHADIGGAIGMGVGFIAMAVTWLGFKQK